jgi:23S rRNA pseudouridine2605 synthase
MEERVQKILSQAGLGSRRACEELIAAGRVRVNGQVVQLGAKADPGQDKITVDGRPIQAPAAHVYIALNKPRNVLSTVSAPDPRPTVRDLVDIPENVYPVGRLDVDSEGLILLTNDGELANRLTHPRYGHEKEYKVLVARRPDEEQLATWRRGVVLEDGYKTQPAEVRQEEAFGKGTWLRLILKEGRKRQIRETGQQIGLPVVRIIRVRIGSLRLGSLKPREWRHLSPEEVEDLKHPSGQAKPRPRKTATRRKPGEEPARPNQTRSKERKSGEAKRPHQAGSRPKRSRETSPRRTSKAPTNPPRKTPSAPPQKNRSKKPRPGS